MSDNEFHAFVYSSLGRLQTRLRFIELMLAGLIGQKIFDWLKLL